MEKLLQLNEFFIEGGHPEISHVLLNLIQPSNEKEEKEKGYFFAICEINHSDNEQLLELQKTMERIENDYYETTDTADKNSLEIVLEKINQQNLPLSNLNLSFNCIVGAIKSNSIVFSYCGEPNILLFYKSKDGNYKKMDLVETPEEEIKKVMFSQIVQGKINPGDYFFLGTKKIINYFNHDRIQKIITTRTPEQSAEHIYKVLNELKNGLSFGGLIIHLKEKLAPESFLEKKSRPQLDNNKKINALFLTEQNTASTLSPSILANLMIAIKNKLKKINIEQNKNQKEKKEIIPINTTAINSIHLKQRFSGKLNKEVFYKIFNNIFKISSKYLATTLKKLGVFIWWTILALYSLFISSIKILKDFFIFVFNIKHQRRQIKDRWSQAFYSYKQNFKHLPLLTKFLFIASIIIILLFISSLILLYNAQKIKKEDFYYQQTFTLIEQKLEMATSSLIYNDRNTAIAIKNEIKQIFSTLNCREKDAATCRNLKESFSEVEKEIQGFVKNPKITPLIDWYTLGFSDIVKFIKLEGKFFGFSQNNNNIYVYNILTKDGTGTVKIPNGMVPFLSSPLNNSKAIILLSKDKKLFKYDIVENSFTELTFILKNNEIQIEDILPYGNRLYTLDKINNQIYRHDAISTGYGLGKDWIKSKDVDIKNSISFAIDGDVYLLKKDGEVIKFTSGEIQPFNISGLEPPLSAGTKIWTCLEDKYLYILDGKEKRLIILNKDGSLKEQYTSEQFEEPVDMIVEEKNKTVYILDKGRIFQIEMR